MTTYTVRMGKLVIGRSPLDLESGTATVRRGAFRPGFGWQLVEPVFELLGAVERGDASARERYERARDALRLVVLDEAGRELPSRRVDIRHVSRGGDEAALEVEVELASDARDAHGEF